jgi:hypothetical protein
MQNSDGSELGMGREHQYPTASYHTRPPQTVTPITFVGFGEFRSSSMPDVPKLPQPHIICANLMFRPMALLAYFVLVI